MLTEEDREFLNEMADMIQYRKTYTNPATKATKLRAIIDRLSAEQPSDARTQPNRATADDVCGYGIGITKDGKRVDPQDFYVEPATKAAPPSDEVAEIADQLSTAIGYFAARSSAASMPNAAADAILRQAHRNIERLRTQPKPVVDVRQLYETMLPFFEGVESAGEALTEGLEKCVASGLIHAAPKMPSEYQLIEALKSSPHTAGRLKAILALFQPQEGK